MVVKHRQTGTMARQNGTVEAGAKTDNKCCAIQNDIASICLLLFLYTMQGIPLGLVAAVPYILQSDANTASYQTLATFSLALWPFSLKLLWAPLVDSIYSVRFGRRKSWMIPAQYAIGIDLLIMAARVDSWLGREPGNPWGQLGVTNPVNIVSLTASFFGLTLLAATQDIAVDGWALTMLTKRNIGWASTCNSVGQVLGYVTAFVLFMSLESPHISNTYLRLTPVEGQGLISFSGFLYFWGVAFIVTTTIVMLLKHEERSTLTQPIQNCMDDARRHMITSLKRKKRSKSQSPTAASSHPSSDGMLGSAEVVVVDEECDTEVSIMMLDDSDMTSRIRPGGSPAAKSIATRHRQDGLVGAGGPGSAPEMSNVIEVFPNRPHAANQSNLDHDDDDASHGNLSLIDTYRVMIGILCLKPILVYIGILFLIKGCLAAADSTFALKLIELGVPKEELSLLSIAILPVQALIPLFATRWSNGPRPLGVFADLAPIRLLLAFNVIPLAYFTPWFAHKVPLPMSSHNMTNLSNSTWSNSTLGFVPPSPQQYQTVFTWKFYTLFLVQSGLYMLVSNLMAVCQMAFQARISDPVVGGTYMTLLNTAANIAGVIPSTLVLYLIDPLSIRVCTNPDTLQAGLASWRATVGANLTGTTPDPNQLLQLGQQWITHNATCKPRVGVTACQLAGGTCVTKLDGFYLQVVLSILLGMVTFPLIVRPAARRLDALSPSAYVFRLSRSRLCRAMKRSGR